MKFGEQLKSARTQLGLDLTEMAARTRISAEALAALEQGNMAALPERTIARSYLQRYARELNLDPAPLLTDFDHLMPMNPRIAQAVRGKLPPPRGLSLPTGLIASVLSVVVVLGALVWGGYAYFKNARGTAAHAAPEPTRVPLASNRQVLLSIQTVPAGARVYLDNVYLGTTPISGFPVEARDQAQLRLERGGYTSLKRPLNLNGDVHLNAQLSVAPKVPVNSAASAAATSTAAVSSQASSTPSAATGAVSAVTASSAASTVGASTAGVSAAGISAAGVTLRFVGRSWVRVQDGGGRQLYMGIPEPGSVQRYPAGISVRVGSAGAVQVSVDGAGEQAFGPAGQPLTRRF